MPDHPDLHTALRALNDAAYAAIRAGRDTTAHPDLDRQKLREIARDTDKLVDDDAGRAAAARAREMNAELPADQRDVMALKGMIE